MLAHNALSVKELSCTRQGHSLFDKLCFDVNPSEILWIEGCNGSGKSTLLRIVAGLATPQKGNIFWRQQLIQELSFNYSRDIHYISHTNGIKLGLTVLENIKLIGHLNLYSNPLDDDILSLLKLHTHQHTKAQYLSAGLKRRLALAKLFLFPKPLWILDEPFTSLDSETQTLLMSHLETHAKNGGLSLVSSHQSIVLNTPIKKLRLPTC